MNKNENTPVRELLYCSKGEQVRKKLTISIRGPYLINKDSVDFRFDEGTAACTIEFSNLIEDSIEVFGMDKLHALTLAVDVDPIIKSMTTKYDFFWETGDPYFE